MSCLSATYDFIPVLFPQSSCHFVNFSMHNCLREQRGLPVGGDVVVPAIAGGLVGNDVAIVTNVSLDPPESDAATAISSSIKEIYRLLDLLRLDPYIVES